MALTVGDDEFVQAKVEELLRVYKNAQERLKRELTSAVLTDFQKFRLSEQIAQVKVIVRALNAKVAELGKSDLIPKSYRIGGELAGESLKRQGVKFSDINFGNRLHTGAIGAMVDQMTLDLLSANQSIDMVASRILRATKQALVSEKQINDIITRGLIEGETLKETSGRLAASLRKRLVDGQFVQAGDRFFTPEHYAKLVVLTRSREAQTAGVINTSLEYEVTLFQVSLHEGACKICLQYQGKVYSLDGSDPRFPKLEKKPGYHPNCAHVLLPFVIDAFTDEEIDAFSRISMDRDLRMEGQVAYSAALKSESKGKPIGVNKTGAVSGKDKGLNPSTTPTTVKPAGVPVSGALFNDGVAGEKSLKHVSEIIDRIHGDGDLPRIPVLAENLPPGYMGYYYPPEIGPEGKQRIGVDFNKKEFPDITLLHEIGHFLDRRGIPRSEDDEEWPSLHGDVVDKWRNAIMKSDAFKTLHTLSFGGFLKVTHKGKTYLRPIDIGEIMYLMRPQEFFARSYAQYIVTKSEDAKLLKQFELSKKKPEGAMVWHNRQWEPDDFLEIEKAFDEMFKEFGWRV